MQEVLIRNQNLANAYHSALVMMSSDGDYVGNPVAYKEMSMTIMVNNPVLEPRISKLLIGGERELQQYELEMTDGLLDFAVGHGLAYTYHQRFAPYMPFVINELYDNPDSRRAVINIRDNEVDGNSNDPACLQSIQFFIREGKLHMKVFFRSNDLVKAFFFNAFALIRLQEIVAENLNIPVGTYTHRANSMHVYERDFDVLKGMVGRIINFSAEDLTYSYEDYYKELMADSLPKIQETVNALREHYGLEIIEL